MRQFVAKFYNIAKKKRPNIASNKTVLNSVWTGEMSKLTFWDIPRNLKVWYFISLICLKSFVFVANPSSGEGAVIYYTAEEHSSI